MNLETAINPELYWEARRVNKRSPVNISIKVFRPQSEQEFDQVVIPKTSKAIVQRNEEIIKYKNNNHYSSFQRSATPLEQETFKSNCKDVGVSTDDISQLMNMKVQQKQMKSARLTRSVLSRDACNRSVSAFQTDRSYTNKEILSPFYKPFQILFSLRKRDQYSDRKHYKQGQDSNYKRYQQNIINNRSSTPQFKENGFKDCSSIQRHFSSTSQLQKTLFDNSQSLKNYLNQPTISPFTNQAIFIPESKTAHKKTNSRNIKGPAFYTQQDFKQSIQNSSHKHKQSQQPYEEDDLSYSSEENFSHVKSTQLNQNQEQIVSNQYIQTEGSQETCCHVESEKHQITRFALEKALKLSEVLMKEVQRLDKIVQRYQHQEKQEDLVYDEEESQCKSEILAEKRQLFKEISCLNVQQSVNVEQKSSVQQLYTTFNKPSSKRNSTNHRDSKENNLQAKSFDILKDVGQSLRDQTMSILELKPEYVKPYLKLITEACIQCSNNKGSLRKDIWEYLYSRYENQVDYRDFLLAIKKFRIEGKMLNNEGIYQMASQVLTEIREKTPTPVFSNKFAQDSKKQNSIIGFLSAARTNKDEPKISSKISNIGKQQKIKGRYMPIGHHQRHTSEAQEKAKPKEEAKKVEEKVRDEPAKKDKIDHKARLGFQTPVNQIRKSPSKQRSSQKLSEIKQKDPKAISRKIQHQDKEAEARRKLFESKKQINKMSKRIFKTKKHQAPLHIYKPKIIQAPAIVKKQETPKRIVAKETPRMPEKKLTPALRRKIEQAFQHKNLVMRKKQMRADKEQRKEKQNKNSQKTWKRVLRTLDFSKDEQDGESQNEYKKIYPRQVVVDKKEHKKAKDLTHKKSLKSIEKRPKKKSLGVKKSKVQPVHKTKIIKKDSPKKKEVVQAKRQYKKMKNLKRVIPQKERLERILKKLVMDLQVSKMDKQRKAKLRALKAINQLFINSKTKSQMFVDSKLIYV